MHVLYRIQGGGTMEGRIIDIFVSLKVVKVKTIKISKRLHILNWSAFQDLSYNFTIILARIGFLNAH